MPNIAAVLKAEIARIARKESKAALASLVASASKARKTSKVTNGRIGQLERQVKALALQLAKQRAPSDTADQDAGDAVRMTGKRVKSLRGRLGVTQAEFGMLVGVSAPAVASWERQPGTLRLRSKARAGLMIARGLRAQEARRRLQEMAVSKRPKGKARGRRRP